MRKTSQAMQRKRLLNRQKQKLNCRRHAQFIQETQCQLASA